MLNKKALAGTAGAPKVYVEDVFSTYLFTQTSTGAISNGIDLAGKGGMVWQKARTLTNTHKLMDTVRGTSSALASDTTQEEFGGTNYITSFNSDGFTTGSYYVNYPVVSWTFRKAEKFFDVVTYTGNGSNRTISHNLGSTPGCIIVKRTDTTGDWYVYHRSNTANPETDYLLLNSTAATADLDTIWNDTAPTSTVFSVGTNSGVNANSGTYVAYLFAHDAGGFGDAGSDNVISCGSYTGTGSAQTLSLGYEPQWVLIKQSSGANDWNIWDNMRGLVVGGTDAYLQPNTSNAENSSGAYDFLSPTATGLTIDPTSSGFNYVNTNGQTYIYIAIRRGPMKTPTSGTSVFAPYVTNTVAASSSGSTSGSALYRSDFVTDFVIQTRKAFADSRYVVNRLTGNQYLVTNSTAAEATSVAPWDSNIGALNFTTDYGQWMFRRAPGFFDVVCYTGTGSATTFSHNLGVVPELMIVKRRDTANAWAVYANNDNTDYLVLNTTAATVDDNTYWNDTSPTSSVFSVGTNNATNASGSTYVAYLFASLSGVSKIGTYTGNGSSVTVTTNFQPRFILVKRTDSTGDWIVSDSARGLVAGNDPYLELNTTDAEVTNEDWVDISSTSFTVNQTTNNANVNTGTYIYLCIA